MKKVSQKDAFFCGIETKLRQKKMVLLKVSGICKYEGDAPVLKDVDFSQKRFQKIAIAGETGSGKSTLLQIIAGLAQPDAGEILLDGEKVKGPEEKLVPGHPAIAYLSQHFELPGFLRVEQALAYSNTISEKDAEKIYETCRIVPLLKRKTDQLSGGERQRIALARLLISSPELLLLDEPFSNLDTAHKKILKSVIRNISEDLGITSILVSHDPADILSWADEILVMKSGKIIQKGRPEKVYRQPVNTYTAGLFGPYSLIETSRINGFSRGIETQGQSLFVRPENFVITQGDQHSLRGEVREARFLGHHYELEVLVSGKIILVKTQKANFSRGDSICLSLPENIWYI